MLISYIIETPYFCLVLSKTLSTWLSWHFAHLGLLGRWHILRISSLVGIFCSTLNFLPTCWRDCLGKVTFWVWIFNLIIKLSWHLSNGVPIFFLGEFPKPWLWVWVAIKRLMNGNVELCCLVSLFKNWCCLGLPFFMQEHQNVQAVSFDKVGSNPVHLLFSKSDLVSKKWVEWNG